MKNLEHLNLKELSIDDQIDINAGESGWYWVAYGLRVALEYMNEAGKGNRMHSAG